MTQLEVLRAVLVYLQHNGTSNWKNSLNAAIMSVSQSTYSSLDDVVNDIWVKFDESESISDFLLNYCGIDLENIDSGSIFGSDAGGSTTISEYDLIPENGSVADLTYPASNSSVTYRDKITINYPNMSSYSQQNRFLVGCLHTFWMNGCIDRFNALFEVPNIELDFLLDTSNPSFVAAVANYIAPGADFPIKQELLYNPSYTTDLDLTNLNGSGRSLGVMLLDTTTLHELTHGVHNMSIPYCADVYPIWFKEGLATTVEGGDFREYALELYLSQITEASLKADFNKENLNQYSRSEFAYVQGYMFFRFLAKQLGQSISPIPPTPTPTGDYKFYDVGDRLVAKGHATSLNDLGRRFIQFAQESGENIQAWELEQDKFDSFYGTTFKVPMKNWELPNDNEENEENVDISGDVGVNSDIITVVSETMPCFYISLQYQNVTSSTYNSYINATGQEKLDELVYGYGDNSHVASVNVSLNRHYSGRTASNNVESRSSVQVYSAPMFKDGGEFIAISPHTLFDKDLWMCEQGGSSCLPLSATGSELNLVQYREQYSSCSSGTSSLVDSKLFPGSGTPWLTISSKNASEYISAGDNQYIEYWFTKTDYSATISFKLSNGIGNDLYQSIAFGMLDNFKESSYMFPLFVAGGNTALSPYIYKYYTSGAICPSFLYGNVYDLDMQNTAMSNSNLLHPTKLYNSNITNFMVLSPQGKWKYITAHTQGFETKPYYRCLCSSVYCTVEDVGGRLLDVVDDLSLTGYNCMFPKMSRNARNTIDTYTVVKKFNIHEYSSPLQRVLVFLNENQNYKENGCMGMIPNVYSGWFKALPCGEIELSGERYLSIPNGWDGRLWLYPRRLSEIVNYEGTDDELRSQWDNRNNVLYNYKICDRVLIPLGVIREDA